MTALGASSLGAASLVAGSSAADEGNASPLHLYADSLTDRATATIVRSRDGEPVSLDCARWLAAADAVDEQIVAGLRGPVLDVGCGPGRHLRALARRGVFGLGVDLSPVAVDLVRDAGAAAIVGSIFDEIPAAGTWRAALLLDGNIGIGGDPVRLLRRVATLLTPGGEILVELAPATEPSRRHQLRLERGALVSAWFPWATLSVADAGHVASACGLEIRATLSAGARRFARFAAAAAYPRERCLRALPSP